MRFFETLIVVLSLSFLGFSFTGQVEPRWVLSLPLITIVVIILHWFVEGNRWQMVPAYVATVLLAVFAVTGNGRHSATSIAVVVIAAVFLLASAALAIILPVFSLPEPGGPYPIGTITQHWTVRNSSPRKLNIQFWYPTDKKDGKRSAYRTSDAQGLKAHLRLTRTHAIVNASVSQEPRKHPVVLFSPGWKGHLTQNTIQFEMLASYGFIVLAMEHPPAENLPEYFDPSREENLRGYAVEVKRRTRDVQFVLDQLEMLNQQDPDGRFTSRVDLSRIGMFGYSFGGALSAEACWADQRIKAGINMDGMMFGGVTKSGVRQPFLFVSDDSGGQSEPDLQSSDPGKRTHAQALQSDCQFIERSLAEYGGYYLRIRGAAHSNFSDRPLYSPLKRLTDAGSIDVRTCVRIVNAYTLAFFEQNLNRKVQPLLNRGNSDYPEAVFRYQRVPGAVDPTLATNGSHLRIL